MLVIGPGRKAAPSAACEGVQSVVALRHRAPPAAAAPAAAQWCWGGAGEGRSGEETCWLGSWGGTRSGMGLLGGWGGTSRAAAGEAWGCAWDSSAWVRRTVGLTVPAARTGRGSGRAPHCCQVSRLGGCAHPPDTHTCSGHCGSSSALGALSWLRAGGAGAVCEPRPWTPGTGWTWLCVGTWEGVMRC